MLGILVLASGLACKPVTRAASAALATGCAGCGPAPLQSIGDVALPGASVRFDYQDVDSVNGHLVVAHMNDNSVDIVALADGSTLQTLADIPTARGVVVAPEAGLTFVTSSPDQLVAIDSVAMTEVRRVTTGSSPDGVGWDGADGVVAVSDQGDGGITLIPDDGAGTGVEYLLGDTTGNVSFDAARSRFWITVEHGSATDQLVAVDPRTGSQVAALNLPGCQGAHGLRLHPDGASAYIACENNDTVARVDLTTGAVTTAASSAGPDVFALDAEKGWLYLAAEDGPTQIFDTSASGLTLIGTQTIGDNAHTVAVDPTTHRVYFPLPVGPNGTPVLRIMEPG